MLWSTWRERSAERRGQTRGYRKAGAARTSAKAAIAVFSALRRGDLCLNADLIDQLPRVDDHIEHVGGEVRARDEHQHQRRGADVLLKGTDSTLGRNPGKERAKTGATWGCGICYYHSVLIRGRHYQDTDPPLSSCLP